MKYLFYALNFLLISTYCSLLLIFILNNFVSINPGPFLEINTDDFISYSITTIGWGEPMDYFVASYPLYKYFVEMPITYILPILIMIYFLKKYPSINLNKKFIFSKLGILNILVLLILIPVIGLNVDLRAVPMPKDGDCYEWGGCKDSARIFTENIHELDISIKENIFNSCKTNGKESFLYGLGPVEYRQGYERKRTDYLLLKGIFLNPATESHSLEEIRANKKNIIKRADKKTINENKVSQLKDFNNLVGGFNDKVTNNLQIVCFHDDGVLNNLLAAYRTHNFERGSGGSSGSVGKLILSGGTDSQIKVAQAEEWDRIGEGIKKRNKLIDAHHRWVTDRFISGDYCSIIDYLDSINKIFADKGIILNYEISYENQCRA
jgi:hypothetical protein